MKYIKYKRIEKNCDTVEDIQIIFDELITEGYEIINYFEKKDSHDLKKFFFNINIIAGKLRTDDKIIL